MINNFAETVFQLRKSVIEYKLVKYINKHAEVANFPRPQNL